VWIAADEVFGRAPRVVPVPDGENFVHILVHNGVQWRERLAKLLGAAVASKIDRS
jgi:hypothetical protein